jgi:predicted phage terminase large subunit-like protein
VAVTLIEREYRRASLYPKQEAAIFDDARYVVIEASTKSGKTVGCLVWLHEQAALTGGAGKNFWWVAPIYSQSKIAYRRLKRFLPDETWEGNETELTIKLLNGSTIWFKSGEKPDSLYGEDVYAAVIDEATRVKPEAWYAVRSTLTATQGPVRVIGNVKGTRNWAYRMARRAESGTFPNMHYAKLTVHDAVEAGIFDGEEARDAQDNLPTAVYQSLYMAEPGEDGVAFFDIAKIGRTTGWPGNAKVARAWDFAVTEPKRGRSPDFTAGVKLAVAGKDVWVLDVIRRRLPPEQSVTLVKQTAQADGPECTQVLEEEFGAAGKMLIAQFRRQLSETPGTGRVASSKPSGGKMARAFHLAASANDGHMSLIEASWNQTFLAEADDFPDVEHDDQIDASAHGYNFLAPTLAPRVTFI